MTAQAFSIGVAQAQCSGTETQVRCVSVVTACAPTQGEAYAACSGGLVTPLSLGPITLYHNSHRLQENSPVIDVGAGQGWSFLSRVEERPDGSRVVVGATGDTTVYPRISGSYRYFSEDRPRGDFTEVWAETQGFSLRHPDGARTNYGWRITSGTAVAYYPVEEIDAYGNRTSFQYSHGGVAVPTKIQLPGGAPVTLSVQSNHLASVTYRGVTHKLVYDGQFKITAVELPDATKISLEYDKLGRNLITKMIDPFGRPRSLTYLLSGNRTALESVTDEDGQIYTFSYDAKTSSMRGPDYFQKNEFAKYNEQNPRSVYKKRTFSGVSPTGALTTDFDVTVDRTGRPVISRDSQGFATRYTYDDTVLPQLDPKDPPTRNPFPVRVENFDGSKQVFTYDATNNFRPLTFTEFDVQGAEIGTTRTTYLDKQRVSAVERVKGGVTLSKMTYSYDGGSLFPSKVETEAVTEASWDSQKGLLTSLTAASGSYLAAEYDDRGDITSATSDGSTVSYSREFSPNGSASVTATSPYMRVTQSSDMLGISSKEKRELLQAPAANGAASLGQAKASAQQPSMLISEDGSSASINLDGSSSSKCASQDGASDCVCSSTCKVNTKGGCDTENSCTCDAVPAYKLTVYPGGTGKGSVSASNPGIDCGTDCDETYRKDTSVSLTATVGSGNIFEGWSGDCSGSGACTVQMSQARYVTATFSSAWNLEIKKSGNGSGSVTASPEGSNCGPDCFTYKNYTNVSLTAKADSDSYFAGWSGGRCAGTSSCSVFMQGPTVISAEFKKRPELTVAIKGSSKDRVVSERAGIDCGTDCNEVYEPKSFVTLIAKPDVESEFVGWEGACVSSKALPTCTVSMTDAQRVTAIFRPVVVLTINVDGPGQVAYVEPPSAWTCGVGKCESKYPLNTRVSLAGYPAYQANFKGWSGECSGTGRCTIEMTKSKSVNATFRRQFTLSVSTYLGWDGRGVKASGSVRSTPAGVDCGSNCQMRLDEGSVVSLAPFPGPESSFTGWSGACSGTGGCQVTMSRDQSVTAAFGNVVRVTVVKQGSGTGTVKAPGNSSIDCGGKCTGEVPRYGGVFLEAIPDSSSSFEGWGAPCSTGLTTCAFAPNSDTTITATFSKDVLKVTKAGLGAGTVSSAPAGIICGSQCMKSFPAGSQVTLTAVPDAASSTFVGWSGACSGTGPCTVTVAGMKEVTATFDNQFPLKVTLDGSGSGTVASARPGISCGADCEESYRAGETVTLRATPAGGSVFKGWSGDCLGTGACSVTMNRAQNVKATFASPTTLFASVNGPGSVRSQPQGIDCGADCWESYQINTSVTLSAVSLQGSNFVGWSGACSGTQKTCTVKMSQIREVTANFFYYWPLLVARTGSGTGTVTGVGINCGTDCSEGHPDGVSMTLKAQAANGSTFSGWSGDCTGTGDKCTLLMNSSKAAVAQFDSGPTLSISKIGSGSGTVSSTDNGINCGNFCSKAYSAGQRITLSATPMSGSTFAGWSGPCSGTGSCTISLSGQSQFVTAIFNAAACVPYCGSKKCGDNGCGGSCGTCSTGYQCNGSQCVYQCQPNCAGRKCGSDGCGGSCGTCAWNQQCSSTGQCQSSCAQNGTAGAVCCPGQGLTLCSDGVCRSSCPTSCTANGQKGSGDCCLPAKRCSDGYCRNSCPPPPTCTGNEQRVAVRCCDGLTQCLDGVCRYLCPSSPQGCVPIGSSRKGACCFGGWRDGQGICQGGSR